MHLTKRTSVELDALSFTEETGHDLSEHSQAPCDSPRNTARMAFNSARNWSLDGIGGASGMVS